MFRAKIYVTLKESVLDPQGKTIRQALESLGFAGIDDVRQGKYFIVTLQAKSETDARQEVEAMCRKLLVNPVIETFRFDLEQAD